MDALNFSRTVMFAQPGLTLSSVELHLEPQTRVVGVVSQLIAAPLLRPATRRREM